MSGFHLIFKKSASLEVLCFLVHVVSSIDVMASTSAFNTPIVGSLTIELPSGSPDSPSYVVVSPGLSSEYVFRGQVDRVESDGNLTFEKIPDYDDLSGFVSPFRSGMLSTERARVRAVLDDNLSIGSLVLENSGSGYTSSPLIEVSIPSSDQSNSMIAELSAEINASGQLSDLLLHITNPGKGYEYEPEITVEGGRHYIRLVESEDNVSGAFFLIQSNSADSLKLENPLDENITDYFSGGCFAEIYQAWTIGSLFGYESSDLFLAYGDQSTADYLYLFRPDHALAENDFVAYFHDGDSWKAKDDPTVDASESLIAPDEAIIIARRNAGEVSAEFSGSVRENGTFIEIPMVGERYLANNPYGVDVLLSELITPSMITTDVNDSNKVKWLAHPQQEVADNVMILSEGVWTTYWHDGTNAGIVEKASASSRAGSGIAGSISSQDLSFSNGIVEHLTNPSNGTNVMITSADHGLRNGFKVTLSGVRGYQTNDEKNQVDENDNVVEDGAGYVFDSSLNDEFIISNVTNDTFELSGKSGDCDYPTNDDGLAVWSTGSRGAGYDSDALVTFVGGGGSGASGVAKINNGSVSSIFITNGGVGYQEPPSVVIHAGGWKSVVSGNVPLNDVVVPAGAGIMLKRLHPNGVKGRIAIPKP